MGTDPIAVGMPRAEVVQIDAVGPIEQCRFLAGDRPVRQKPGVRSLEGIDLLHVRLRPFVCDDLGDRRELAVAAGVVGAGAAVDDHRHRPVGCGLDGVEDRSPPAWQLRVNDDDAVLDTKLPGWGRPILDAIQAATDMRAPSTKIRFISLPARQLPSAASEAQMISSSLRA